MIKFENYGRFFFVLRYVGGDEVTFMNQSSPYGMAEVMDYIHNHMNVNPMIFAAAICDADTGELVATIENDDSGDDFDDYDCDNDMGFDPYLGCYTDDC